MKCPVCGHKVRPSKKCPGKYLCDTCRKRFPASAVIPDDTDTRSARSSAHKHGSVSRKKRPAARQQAFFDDPLNGPETYHSTAAAMRSMRKNVPEAEEAEAQKKATEKKETEKVSTDKPFSGNESSVQEHAPVPEPVISSGQEDEPAAKPTPVSKNDTAGTKSDVSSDDVTSPDQLTTPKKKHKKSLPFIILILILIIIAVIFLFPKCTLLLTILPALQHRRRQLMPPKRSISKMRPPHTMALRSRWTAT